MRPSVDVVKELVTSMHEIVIDYGDLVQTPATIKGLVPGTSFFPGGSGLWCGEKPNGPLPEFFPKSPVMFVGNYWFNENGFKQAKSRGQEDVNQSTGFWASMRAYLKACQLDPRDCFFTNSLMGLTPGNGSATGRLTGDGPNFRKECRIFFGAQIRIVKPRVVALMGNHAQEELGGVTFNFPTVGIPHPSSLRTKPNQLEDAAKKKVAALLPVL